MNLEEAPALAPLVEAQKKALQGSPHQQAAQYIPFARSFFWDQVNAPAPRRRSTIRSITPNSGPSLRSGFDTDAKPQYVVWRTEEIPAKTPASLAAAMPRVKALWKHLKARDMARERAEKLADAIRAGGRVPRFRSPSRSSISRKHWLPNSPRLPRPRSGSRHSRSMASARSRRSLIPAPGNRCSSMSVHPRPRRFTRSSSRRARTSSTPLARWDKKCSMSEPSR